MSTEEFQRSDKFLWDNIYPVVVNDWNELKPRDQNGKVVYGSDSDSDSDSSNGRDDSSSGNGSGSGSGNGTDSQSSEAEAEAEANAAIGSDGSRYPRVVPVRPKTLYAGWLEQVVDRHQQNEDTNAGSVMYV